MEYSTPELRSLASLSYLTLGAGGSTLDGTGLNNQRGKGNDDQDDGGPNTPN